jgi:hypothetical protein
LSQVISLPELVSPPRSQFARPRTSIRFALPSSLPPHLPRPSSSSISSARSGACISATATSAMKCTSSICGRHLAWGYVDQPPHGRPPGAHRRNPLRHFAHRRPHLQLFAGGVMVIAHRPTHPPVWRAAPRSGPGHDRRHRCPRLPRHWQLPHHELLRALLLDGLHARPAHRRRKRSPARLAPLRTHRRPGNRKQALHRLLSHRASSPACSSALSAASSSRAGAPPALPCFCSSPCPTCFGSGPTTSPPEFLHNIGHSDKNSAAPHHFLYEQIKILFLHRPHLDRRHCLARSRPLPRVALRCLHLSRLPFDDDGHARQGLLRGAHLPRPLCRRCSRTRQDRPPRLAVHLPTR